MGESSVPNIKMRFMPSNESAFNFSLCILHLEIQFIVLRSPRQEVDLLYKMVIAVKCVYNKPVFDFLNMIKLIENVNRIPVIVQLTF